MVCSAYIRCAYSYFRLFPPILYDYVVKDGAFSFFETLPSPFRFCLSYSTVQHLHLATVKEPQHFFPVFVRGSLPMLPDGSVWVRRSPDS
ncbi:unnamed protein product [Ectocarpus sp. CCAP 1310/34]|nr:unnamed protein product [Ectocarpus sp. CCAP 1310/34]